MKKRIMILAALLALAMTGCASVRDRLGKQMLKKSGVAELEEYEQYLQYEQNGQLDEKGFAKEGLPEEQEIPDGSVHLTFAKNTNLNVRYYADADAAQLLEPAGCYRMPGSSIYARAAAESGAGGLYRLAGFRLYAYGADGSRRELETIPAAPENGLTGFSIPENGAEEISVEPYGVYEERVLTLRDYCTAEDGRQTELSGTWTVNDAQYEQDTVSVSPLLDCIVSYRFDSDTYFCCSSEPECFYSSNVDGVVVFPQQGASGEDESYAVELRKYFSASLVSDAERTVTIGGEPQTVGADEKLSVSHLKFGDTVTVLTDRPWPELEKSRDLILTGEEENTAAPENERWRYTLVVPEVDGVFRFDPADYTYEHGTVRFTCFGETVTGVQYLAQKSRIYYEQKTADDGYWLPGDENYIVVGDEEDTVRQLRDICFLKKMPVTVNLKQPACGGTIRYEAEGKTLLGSTFKTYSGTEIIMHFEPWEGWRCSAENGSVYTAEAGSTAEIRVGGKSVNELFTESEEHKPVLTFSLEKSVGEELSFTVSASGLKKEVSYGGGWKVTDIFNTASDRYDLIKGSQILFSEKIGTEKAIELDISNRAKRAGHAVRIQITRTDDKKNREVEIRYLTDIAEKPEPIVIYEYPGVSSSAKTYTSIDISVGVDEVVTHAAALPAPHTVMRLRNADTGTLLKSGDLIGKEQKVVISISPEAGYYVTGRLAFNDFYQETMKYGDYLKNLSTIIDEHRATKYITLTLDASDSFATYSYFLDAAAKSGTVQAKDGQILTLTYTIKDSAYHISEDGTWLPEFLKPDKKVTTTLMVTADMDGRTICKEDFGIRVTKGG